MISAALGDLRRPDEEEEEEARRRASAATERRDDDDDDDDDVRVVVVAYWPMGFAARLFIPAVLFAREIGDGDRHEAKSGIVCAAMRLLLAASSCRWSVID